MTADGMAVTVRWENPPQRALVGHGGKGNRKTLREVTAACRPLIEAAKARPGRWLVVYTGRPNAGRRSLMAQGGYGFTPPERWEIVQSAREDGTGDTSIWVRWLAGSPDEVVEGDLAAAYEQIDHGRVGAVAAAKAPVAPPTRTPSTATTRGPVTRLPAAADLQLLCECQHVRRLHPDGRGTYGGECRRTGCLCGGYAPKVTSS